MGLDVAVPPCKCEGAAIDHENFQDVRVLASCREPCGRERGDAAKSAKAVGNDGDYTAQFWDNHVGCHREEVCGEQAHEFAAERARRGGSLWEVPYDASTACAAFEHERGGTQVEMDLPNVGSVSDGEAGTVMNTMQQPVVIANQMEGILQP